MTYEAIHQHHQSTEKSLHLYDISKCCILFALIFIDKSQYKFDDVCMKSSHHDK